MILNRESARRAMLGGCILGGGGGGSAAMAGELVAGLDDYAPLTLTPLSALESDAVVLTVGLVGAPAAKDLFVSPAAMIRAVELCRENLPDVKIGGIMTNENGAFATVNGWLQAAALGLPLIDAQCNGRAHPTGVMGSMMLHKDPSYFTTMAFAGGNPDKNLYLEGVVRGTIDQTSPLVRQASVMAGGMVGVARNPVTAAYVRANGAVGGISQAIELGRRYEEGLKTSPMAAAQAAADFLHGRILAHGTVERCELETRGGFDVGTFAVGDCTLSFWNEYMTADTADGGRAATFPDLIMTLDAETGAPVTSANVRAGQELIILTTGEKHLNLAATMHDLGLLQEAETVVGREMRPYWEF